MIWPRPTCLIILLAAASLDAAGHLWIPPANALFEEELGFMAIWHRMPVTVWGTIPQWISAVSAMAIVAVTIFGLIEAQPIFENASLKEENARLARENRQRENTLRLAETAIAEQEARTWLYVCRQYVTKTSGAATQISFFGEPAWEDLGQSGSTMAIKFPNLYEVRTGWNLLRNAVVREELDLLQAEDKARFEAFVEDFGRRNAAILDKPLDPENGEIRTGEQEEERERSLAVWREFQVLLEEMLSECEAQAP